MKVKVLYFSKKGNTEKVAKAIAEAAGAESEMVPPAYPCENEKLVFLGSGSYGGKTHSTMEKFINTLTTERVKNVALFGTYTGNVDSLDAMKKQLVERGINVLDNQFTCKGKSMFKNRSNPDENDIKAAKDFAKKVLEIV